MESMESSGSCKSRGMAGAWGRGSEEGVELCAPGRNLDFIPKSVGSLRDKLSPTDVSTKGGGQQSKRFSRPYLLEMHANLYS